MSSYQASVLLVDDDPAMRRILSKWLERDGYHTSGVSDGREALEAIQANCPDFLITDWEMPQMDGLALCRGVRQMNLPSYVYILFLTVKSAPAEMIKGLEAGADEFLAKPVDQGELLARMHAGARVLELQRRLGQLARTDALTGLTTQRVFYETLEREWARVKRSGAPLSCAMLDIDFFKRVNDVHGHPAGDAILKSTAELLQKNCRASDLPCRYGGEEFCVLLPDTTEEDAVRWAERVRKTLSGNVISNNGRDLRITCSFGVAQRQDDTQTAEELVDQADQALLCAKQSGRDSVVAFQSLSDANNVDVRKSSRHGVFQDITASQVMSPMVACLGQDESVGQAADFFLRSRINSTPVVDADGKLVGILSEKDLMAAMVSLKSWQTPVRDVMKPNVIWYEEDTPIETIYEFLCRVSIRRVVIVAGDRPIGTISRGTLLRWFRNLVVAKGLLEHELNAREIPNADARRSRHRMTEAAGALEALASDLQSRLRAERDVVPYIVGGATRMQDLVNDLLAYARFAGEPAGAAKPLTVNANHMD
ncbi:MAG: diguanylate cyclase [Planctomycetia bacterium]|nr:diguanylate cyclase [Planctomycetia bacterium]